MFLISCTGPPPNYSGIRHVWRTGMLGLPSQPPWCFYTREQIRSAQADHMNLNSMMAGGTGLRADAADYGPGSIGPKPGSIGPKPLFRTLVACHVRSWTQTDCVTTCKRGNKWRVQLQKVFLSSPDLPLDGGYSWIM